MGLASSIPLVIPFAVVTGFGNGLLLPSLPTWALGTLGFEQRSRGTGVWTSDLFSRSSARSSSELSVPSAANWADSTASRNTGLLQGS